MLPIKLLLHIHNPPEAVFEALSSVEHLKQWYTTDIEGKTGLNDTLTFKFGEMGYTVQITQLVPGKVVEWTAKEADIPISGHVFRFELEAVEAKTKIRFAHEGFETQDDMHANLTFSWAKYLESLRQHCQKGAGEAFGSDSYRI